MQTREESIGTAALWYCVLAGPVAWSAQLSLDYLFEEWIACTPGFRNPGYIWNLSTNTWVALTNAFFAAVVVLALVMSIVRYRAFRRSDPTTGNRARFMALAGIINSSLFLLPIVMAFAPVVMLHRCQVSP